MGPQSQHHLPVSQVTSPWLLSLISGLIAIQVNLVAKAPQLNFVDYSLLPWAIAGLWVWQRQHRFQFAGGRAASLAGLLLLGLVLLKSAFYLRPSAFPIVFPLLAAISLLLLVEGFKGLWHYRPLLLLLLVLGPTNILLPRWFVDISPLTAKFSAAVLWYSSFDVTRQGTLLILPTGTIDVFAGCSGIESIGYLFCISIAAIIIFPVRWRTGAIASLSAMAIAFIVNGIRVALLAVLVANSQEGAFDYWHTGEGSSLFNLLSVAIFMSIYLFVLTPSPSKSDAQNT